MTGQSLTLGDRATVWLSVRGDLFEQSFPVLTPRRWANDLPTMQRLLERLHTWQPPER